MAEGNCLIYAHFVDRLGRNGGWELMTQSNCREVKANSIDPSSTVFRWQWAHATISIGPGYQTHFAEHIRVAKLES